MSDQPIALVTGANRGLGLETARQLARAGIRVLAGSRDPSRGQAAHETLIFEGVEVWFVALDVTRDDHIGKIVRRLEADAGRLDILVNNAGMLHSEEPLFSNSTLHISAAALRETFAVNFFGQVALTQALLPLLKRSPAARIVNVSSILGSLELHSRPDRDGAQVKPFAYDASKTALNQFTIHLAAALRDTSIKVNSAHPGWVKTDLGSDQAPMGVEEGARTAVRLATLDADGPTGGFFHFGERIPW